MLSINEIQIRDPYVLTDPEEGCYYLYGTTDKEPWSGQAQGFQAYKSSDLEQWEGPYPVFTPPADFWADRNFWAPEVHLYRGAYYMPASFKSADHRRAVHILWSQNPLGPFLPLSREPVTPAGWECLDGTLYLDDAGSPWLIFSHEWTQIHDGAMCCMRLKEDLKAGCSLPAVMFRASRSGWSTNDTGDVVKGEGENYVTDGPFLMRPKDGGLMLLWSSYSAAGYSIGTAYSASGKITGPWRHAAKPFFSADGGHGMVFCTLDGRMMLAIHQPNRTPYERARFIPVRLRGQDLELLE